MDRRDFAMSYVKKKRVKHLLFYLDLMHQMHFVDFNLSLYNSLDERLRLNSFKMIHRQLECATYPPT